MAVGAVPRMAEVASGLTAVPRKEVAVSDPTAAAAAGVVPQKAEVASGPMAFGVVPRMVEAASGQIAAVGVDPRKAEEASGPFAVEEGEVRGETSRQIPLGEVAVVDQIQSTLVGLVAWEETPEEGAY